MQPFQRIGHHKGKNNTMKKLILPFLFLPLFAAAQTIPNGNFESWFWVGWSENPEFWVTDNTELAPTVTKDFDSYEGEIAMRVTAQPMGVSDYGEANTLFEIDEIPAALNFYAKTAVEYGGVSVDVTFLNQDIEVYTVNWFGTENMVEYTLVSIPLSQVLPPPGIVTHARISVSAQVGDLIAGIAWISVDAMEFGETLSVKKMELSNFKIYPNPASENLIIQSNGSSLGNLKITDTLGKIVLEKQVPDNQTTIDIQNLAAGVYMISSDEGNMKASRFIVH